MKKLVIATFNIDKNHGNFPNRVYSLSNIISKYKFDIICLQDDFDSKSFSSSKFINLELDYNYSTTKVNQLDEKDEICSSNLTILSKYCKKRSHLNTDYRNT